MVVMSRMRVCESEYLPVRKADTLPQSTSLTTPCRRPNTQSLPLSPSTTQMTNPPPINQLINQAIEYPMKMAMVVWCVSDEDAEKMNNENSASSRRLFKYSLYRPQKTQDLLHSMRFLFFLS